MINSSKPRLARSAIAFTAFNFINAVIPFLLLPLLTSHLCPEDYALIAMFQLMTNFALPLLGINANSALVRSYYDREEINDFRSYTGNVAILLLATVPALLLLILVFGEQLESLYSVPVKYLWVIVALALSQKISELVLSIWRAEQSVFKFGIFNMLKACLDLGVSIALIVVFKHSWEGRIEGQVFAATMFAMVACFFLFKERRISFAVNVSYMKHAARFGAPLILHALSTIIIIYSDRLFIAKMVNLEQMGLYSAGFQIGMVISLLQNSFNQAWTPWLFEKLNGDSYAVKRKIVKITYIYIVAILAFVSVFYIVTPFIMSTFIADRYSEAILFVPWVALGFAMNGMYKMFVGYLFYLKRTGYIAALTIITAVVNIALNYVLIGHFGTIGAAYATCLSFTLQAVLAWMFSSRLYPMPWFDFLAAGTRVSGGQK